MLRHFGITRLANITGLDRIGIPVVQAIRPMSRSLSVKQGKGRTECAAFASGAMEAVEAWHGENISPNAFQIRPKDIDFTDPYLLAFGKMPDGFDEKKLSWAIGLDLITGSPSAVPQDLVSLDFTVPMQCSAFQKSSNGLASGNSLAEAVASALYGNN